MLKPVVLANGSGNMFNGEEADEYVYDSLPLRQDVG
jgi:hypothetical protein